MAGETGNAIDIDSVEVVIGLVGGMGVNFDQVQDGLRQRLEDEYGFTVVDISITALYERFERYHDWKSTTGSHRSQVYYERAIEIGNEIRARIGDAALAQLAVDEIRQRRSELPLRFAYVIHSLKRPEEVQQLREVYGALFYSLSIYAEEKTRLRRLAARFAETAGRGDDVADATSQAMRLMRRDVEEPGDHGQALRKAFQIGDFFLRADEGAELDDSLARFLELILGKPFVSPTKGELAMMHAYASGLRSADLSRQVGAAIVARDGRLLATGCNEVPRAGGGQFWAGDPDDARDFRLGCDQNDVMKRKTIVQLINVLGGRGMLLPEKENEGAEKLYQQLRESGDLEGTRIDALIEFGRIVHAENAAIDLAAREGVMIRDADLYCTTFPCHMCARVIIDAGIRNVFYIEPYPKSATESLYAGGIIRIDPDLSRAQYEARLSSERDEEDPVYFIPFEGVAPRRFVDLFRAGRRKELDTVDGDAVRFTPRSARPRSSPILPSYRAAEELVSRAADGFAARIAVDETVEKPREPLVQNE